MIFKTKKSGEVHAFTDTGCIPVAKIYPQPYMRVWIIPTGIKHEDFIEVAECIKRLHKGEDADNES